MLNRNIDVSLKQKLLEIDSKNKYKIFKGLYLLSGKELIF
jgi:hypothetical protein